MESSSYCPVPGRSHLLSHSDQYRRNTRENDQTNCRRLRQYLHTSNISSGPRHLPARHSTRGNIHAARGYRNCLICSVLSWTSRSTPLRSISLRRKQINYLRGDSRHAKAQRQLGHNRSRHSTQWTASDPSRTACHLLGRNISLI